MILKNLEELTNQIRNELSKSYYLDAVRAYHAGAYRSSIMSLWITVVYDILSKIRELQTEGDSQADQFINTLDGAIDNCNLNQLQSIEGNILDTAKDGFEFFSEHEYEDLSRLKDDRNKCAHPAFVEKETLFKPSAELVRTHLTHVVTHLLQHPPVQGKNAINRILSDLQLESFPSEPNNAFYFLESRYLKRAKESLIRNLTIIMLKRYLMGEDKSINRNNITNTLLALKYNNQKIYEEVVKEKIKSIASKIDDSKLILLIELVNEDSLIWLYIDKACQLRISTYLKMYEVNLRVYQNSENLKIF